MPNVSEKPIAFRTLHESPVVSVREYRCRIGRGGPAEEEQVDRDQIVLMRQGAFSKHFGSRSVTADVNQAVFFSRASSYRVSHPTDCGDRGTVLVPSPPVLHDLVRELDPTVDDHPERPFPFVTGPCKPEVFWRHRDLVGRLESAKEEATEPLWVDVTALQLMAEVLEAAFERQGRARTGRRAGTDADRADRVEAVKQYLAEQLHEAVTLGEIAQVAGASPFHLTRIFQRHTGTPIYRYLTQLRLRTAHERLMEGADDLTMLALELGFSSHGHFTGAFTRAFGITPSEVRRGAVAKRARIWKS